MYKVILVEDEELVREAIRDIIDWNSLGLSLVGEAGDGREALEIISKIQPDIILTDIYMPFIDGLELIEKAKQIIPTAKFVIITGYEKFEYAKRAIKLNVSNYILKPVTSSELTNILRKIKEELDQEIAERKNIENLKRQLQENMEALRERFLMNLVFKKMSQQEIMKNMDKYNLDLTGESYIVAVLTIDNLKEVNEIFGEENQQLCDFAILNISKEILQRYNQHIIFSDQEQQFTILFINNDSLIKHFKNYVIQILREIILSIRRYINIGITAGVGDEYNTLDKIRYSYQDALTALEYKVLVGKERVIVKSDVERKPSLPYQKVHEIFERLKYTIKLGLHNEVKKELDNFFNFVTSLDLNILDFRTMLLEMMVTIVKAYADICIDSSRSLFDFTLFEQLFKINNIDEIKKYFEGLCSQLSKKILQMREDDYSIIVQKACAYIEENYHLSGITIQDVCDYLHLSQSYFSKIFKSGTGETFTEYLTKVRIEKAKELLRNTNLKIYEIAQQVGYDDPHYFSYSFKKKVGISPMEYRGRWDGV